MTHTIIRHAGSGVWCYQGGDDTPPKERFNHRPVDKHGQFLHTRGKIANVRCLPMRNRCTVLCAEKHKWRNESLLMMKTRENSRIRRGTMVLPSMRVVSGARCTMVFGAAQQLE